MANKKLTDLTELTTPADNDFLYIVDVSDTTESAQGTSKKIRKDKVDSGASKENIANKQNDLTPDGTGTKYPTVDAVNTIDLQKAIDVNGEAFFNNLEGSQYVAFFKDVEGASKKSIISSGSDVGDSEIEIIDTGITLRNFNQITQENTSVGGSEGQFSIFQTGNSGAASTSVAFTPPLADTTLNFPAKTVAGTYTLATTDEISTLDSNVVHKTGDETITGSKTFQTDTSSASITILNSGPASHPAQKIYNTGAGNGLEIDFTTGTGDAIAVFNNDTKTIFLSREGGVSSNINYIKSSLKLLNSDADLYGDISLNLDRYLFNNKSGNLQFLTQNSGFVTYKSPTISGTFSNANLTANRTFTLPDATGTIPIVSQIITNGVTDKSPSEDAVFDALANVTRNIIAKSGPNTTLTGTLTNTILKSVLITSNTYSDYDVLNIPSLKFEKTGTNANAIFKIYINTVNSISGATLIGTYTASTTSTLIKMTRSYSLRNGFLIGVIFSGSVSSDIGASVSPVGSTAFDVTTNNYLIITGQLGNINDSILLSEIIIQK